MQAATHEITFGPLWSPTPQVWCLGWLQLKVEQPARFELDFRRGNTDSKLAN